MTVCGAGHLAEGLATVWYSIWWQGNGREAPEKKYEALCHSHGSPCDANLNEL